jgi:hypothetical protein
LAKVQIQNYITWINSHLKKRTGCQLVVDLQADLASGVALAHLIEIISGASLASSGEINMQPKSLHEYRENVEGILRFMHASAIKMHATTAREIVDGNLKAIMRLVLALAAHFKPSNVQPYKVVADAMQTHRQHRLSSNTNNNNNNGPACNPVVQSASLTNHQHPQYHNQTGAYNGKRSSSTNNVHTTNGTYVINGGEVVSTCIGNNQHYQHQLDRNNQSNNFHLMYSILILAKKMLGAVLQ